MVTEGDTPCLETREQTYRRRRYNDFYVPRDVILSAAFWQLSATAIRVYLIFLNKRVMRKFQGGKQKRSGKSKYYVENDGQIQFTYKEAEQKYGISRSAFRSTIDLLVAVGLIDIAQTGSGLRRDCTFYAISERWRLYGTPEFIVKTRPKRRQLYGFTKGNICGKRKFSTAKNNTCSSVESNT